MTADDVTARFSRRTLLRTGLVGVVLLGAGASVLAFQKPHLSATNKLKVLSPAEYAVLVAVAERICPRLGPLAPGATALDIASRADELFVSADQDAREGIKMVLNVFDNALTGALFAERAQRFTALGRAEQERELCHWRDSRLGFRRTVFHALNALVSALYFGHEKTWEGVGYPGPPSPSGLRAAYAENLVDLHTLKAVAPPKGS